jgi:hypothetical protein
MACNDESCFEVRGRIEDEEDASIETIVRTKLRRNGQEAGPPVNVNPEDADEFLPATVVDTLSRERGILLREASCPDGCFCAIPEGAVPRNPQVETEELTLRFVYETSRLVQTADPRNPDASVDRLFDERGNLVRPDAETERVGSPVAVVRFDGTLYWIPLWTRYAAEVRVRARLHTFELQGRCQPLPPYSDERIPA